MFDQNKIIRIKNLLKLNPKGLTITEISQKLKLSRISVAKYLDILLISGQVEMKLFGAAKAYFLSSRIPISAMLSFSSDHIVILDNHLHILQINENFRKFLGRDIDNFLGNDMSDPSLLFLKELPLHSLLESEAGEKEYIKDLTLTKDGKTYYFKTKVIPTVFDDGTQGLTIILEDLTKEKQAEQIKTFLASIVESSNEGIIGKDLQGIILSWNKAAEKMFGYTADEIIGHPITILVPDEQRDEISFLLERARKGEVVTQFETKRRKKTGETIDVTLTISPIRDNKGRVMAISTISRDITDIKKMKEEIRINQEKLQEIIEFFPDPTYILGRDRNILGWNTAMEEMSSIKKPDILGKNALTHLKEIYGTSRPMLIDLLDKSENEISTPHLNMRKTSASVSSEIFLPKSEKYLWVKASPLYDKAGNFIGAIESARDITAWKKAEKSLERIQEIKIHDTEDNIQNLIEEKDALIHEIIRNQENLSVKTLLEKALDIRNYKIIIIDWRGNIIYMSDAAADVLGVDDGKAMVGMNLYGRIDKDSIQAFHDLMFSRKSSLILLDCTFSSGDRMITIKLSARLVKEKDEVLGYIIHCEE